MCVVIAVVGAIADIAQPLVIMKREAVTTIGIVIMTEETVTVIDRGTGTGSETDLETATGIETTNVDIAPMSPLTRSVIATANDTAVLAGMEVQNAGVRTGLETEAVVPMITQMTEKLNDTGDMKKPKARIGG